MNIRKIILSILLIGFILIPFSADAATKKKKTVRNIEIQTKDEMILSGTLTIPESASIKSKVPVVILLPSLGSNRLAYTALANNLKAKNIASLALDTRGHHYSTTKLSGKKSFWQNYSNKVFAKYPTDIIETLDYLKDNYVALNMSRISIVGADVTANAAIIATAKKKYPIKSLVLISPSRTFKGLSTSQDFMTYTSPVTIIVSKNDVAHYQDAQILSRYVAGKVNFITTQKGGTGDNILKQNPGLNNTIADWISKNI